jgi:glutamate--cysteine ligase
VKLTRAACRAYLDETTFRLRPKDYGEKYPSWPGSVGLEIEMLPVVAERPDDPESPPYPRAVPLQGPGSSAEILRALAAARGWKTVDTEDDHGRPMLLKIDLDSADNLSFEPGGQVEFSSKPYPCLADAVRRMREIQKILDAAYAPHGMRFTQVGVNPWHTVEELGLQMPKARYRAMNQYFASIGEFGQRMMRQSCTVQVNLDFGPDERTLASRYLACQLLAPIAAGIFAFSPVVDRKAQGIAGFRTRIWRHVDATRTGVPGLAELAAAAGRLTRDHCIDTYLDFALSANVVFVTGADYRVPDGKPTGTTFGEWLERPLFGVSPTLDDFAVHMTLLFPEVRPRGFLEIRSVDCQARPFEAVPAVFLTGILYDERSLGRAIELLLPHAARVPELLVKAEGGLADAALARLAKEMMTLAAEGFARQTTCFKKGCSERELTAFRERFTDRGRSPADDVMDRMRAQGAPYLSSAGLKALEEEWTALVTC